MRLTIQKFIQIIKLLILIILILASGCASSKRIKFLHIPNEYLNTVIPESYSSYPIVFLLKSSTYKVINGLETEYHEVFKIQNKSGLKYGNVAVKIPSHSRLINVEGRVILPDGKTVNLEKEDIFTEYEYNKSILGKKQEIKKLAMPGVIVGSIIEYKYKLKLPWIIPPPWYFSTAFPVIESKVTVKANPLIRINYLVQESEKITIDVDKTYDSSLVNNVITLSARNIPPMPFETGVPAFNEVASYVTFTIPYVFSKEFKIEGSSWGDVSQKYWTIVKNYIDQKESYGIDSLVSRYKYLSRSEKITEIFKFVRDSVRYSAIYAGSGIIPMDPKIVSKKRYGDCKAKTMLLIVLLQKSGVKAYPLLCKTRSEGKLFQKLYTLQQFNHACVVIPGSKGNEDITTDNINILDPTNVYNNPGELHSEIAGTYGLIVSENKGKIIKIPPISYKSNRLVQRCDIYLGSDNLNVNVNNRYYGDLAKSLIPIIEAMNYRYLKNRVLKHFKCGILTDFKVANATEDKVQINFNLQISGGLFNRHSRTKTIIPIIKDLSLYTFLADVKRVYPIDLRYQYTYLDSIVIHIPPQFATLDIPEDFSTSSRTMEYSLKCIKDRREIILIENLIVKKPKIVKADYNKFRKQLEKIYRYREKVLINLKKV